MKKTCILVFLIGMISSIQFAATQFRTADSDILMVPGASKSLVLIDARVTDENGNYVPGLQAEDFEVYQDGRQQEIAKFYALDHMDTQVDPRNVVFLVDDLGLSKAKFNQARGALKYFAEKVMSPADQVAIAQISAGGFVVQPLTSDNQKLLTAADRWQWCMDAARPFGSLAQAFPSSSTFIRSCSGST
jgi:VWFA-related protein